MQTSKVVHHKYVDYGRGKSHTRHRFHGTSCSSVCNFFFFNRKVGSDYLRSNWYPLSLHQQDRGRPLFARRCYGRQFFGGAISCFVDRFGWFRPFLEPDPRNSSPWVPTYPPRYKLRACSVSLTRAFRSSETPLVELYSAHTMHCGGPQRGIGAGRVA